MLKIICQNNSKENMMKNINYNKKNNKNIMRQCGKMKYSKINSNFIKCKMIYQNNNLKLMKTM